MAGRYIPPALREKSESQGSGYLPPALRKKSESNGSYIRPTTDALDALPDKALHSLREIEHFYWPDEDARNYTGKSKTLHDSAGTPGVLSYILLFKGANPRWDQDGIIFTKSSLELLPADLTDGIDPEPTSEGTDNNTTRTEGDIKHITNPAEPQSKKSQPIAIFSQDSVVHLPGIRNFKFLGYYRIVRLTFLEPRTPELVRMLEQKWTLTNSRGQVRQKQRGREGWNESMGHRWAVVKLERDENADAVLGKPEIQKIEEEPLAPKSVNEMLQELRMGPASKDDDAGQEKAHDKT